MITIYRRQGNGTIEERPLATEEAVPPDAVWIDMMSPESHEVVAVQNAYHVELPTPTEMSEIEASSRLYVERGAVVLTTAVLYDSETPDPDVGDLTMVLTDRVLITLRYMRPRAIQNFSALVRRQPELMASPYDTLLHLLDAVIDRTADVLEYIWRRYDELAQFVFRENLPGVGLPRRRRTDKSAKRPARRREDRFMVVLKGIGQIGDLTQMVRVCLNGMQRLLPFLITVTAMRATDEQSVLLKTLDRDLRSLSDQAQFLSQETSFLLNATLGMINIEQNNIIKIFSIAAVVFLPPTLVGTIYGMNFHNMPELDWIWGYPLSIVLMVASAWLPVWYFRHRGWL